MTYPIPLTNPAQANAPVLVNDNLAAIAHAAVYAYDVENSTGLTWAYHGGRWAGYSVADGTLTLTNAATNYIVVAVASGVISTSTATTNWNDTTNYARVYRVTTSGSVVSNLNGSDFDYRAGPGGVHGSVGGSLVTSVNGLTGAVDIGLAIAAATSKATPVDADSLALSDSAAANVLKKLTWANLKATAKTYFDTLYALTGLATASGLTMASARLLGRTTAATGAVEEIVVGSGLTLSAGTLSASGGGGVVSTDTIWDAAGDLLYGTGSNAGARLAVGTALQVLRVNAGVTAPEWYTLQGDGLDVDAAGFRGIPQNAQTGNYTLVAADAGKHIYHASGAGSGDTYTIPANSSVAFEIGTSVTFANMAADAVSIAITTDTLYLAGAGTTGTRTLAQYGVCTAVKLTSTTWLISGTGLT